MILLALASSLIACNPSTTQHNTYNGTRSEMSGGGNTKDPGDGTGGSTGDGGGGQGILCKKTKDQRVSDQLFVRDIYEAIYNHNRKIKNVSNDSVDNGRVQSRSIEVLTDALKKFYGPASRTIEFTQEKFWIQFVEKISFIDDDKKLYPSQDANSPIALPEGCQLVQIAYWDDAGGSNEEGTLYIKKSLWEKLDQLNKIGLLAHEYFFKLARKANFKNSDMIRLKVGQLLSEAGIAPLFNNWPLSSDPLIASSLPKNSIGFKYCHGTSEEDPSANLQFYQYAGSDQRLHLAIPLLRSNYISINPFQTSSFSSTLIENLALAKATDLFLYQTHASYFGVTGLVPPEQWANLWYNSDDLVNFSWNQNITKRFHSLLKDLSREQEVLWTGYFSHSTNPIKVEIVNPTFNKKLNSFDVLKTEEDLARTIHSKIENAVRECAGGRYEIDSNNRAAVVILKKEISDSISEGVYPDNFPKWKSFISNVIGKYSKGSTNSCKLMKTGIFQNSLPDLLFKLTTRTHSNEDVTLALGLDAFTDDNKDRIPFGRIRVSQGSSTIHFNLKCQDYTDIYSEITNENLKNDTENTIVPNKTVSVTPEIAFSAKRLASTDWSESGKPLADAYKNLITSRNAQLPQEILKIQKVADFLKFDQSDYKNLFERFYLNQRLRCNHKHPAYFSETCKQFEYFIENLKKETKLKLSPCEFYYDDSSTMLIEQTCMTVEMASSSNKYKVYVNKGISHQPSIDYFNFEFVRQIPEKLQ